MRKLTILAALAVLAVVLGSVSMPVYSIGPGPARDVVPRIDVSGRTVYPSEGRFVLTSVIVDRLTPFEAFVAWWDPARSVVPERAVLVPGETEEEGSRRSVSEMDQSKIDAAYVVLTELTGYPEAHGEGVLVESVVAGCPAEGRLFPGDVIVSVDGANLRDSAHFAEVLDAAPYDQSLGFVVDADGETERVSLTRKRCADSPDPLVGIRPLDTFPFEVSISSGEIGGPSAGLMWALGLYDLLTPNDLTAGRIVAGTGAIDLEGNVGPIGGIEQKILAADRAGADLFLVPQDNFEAARRVISDLTLVSVRSIEDAIELLERG
jgi:PDZ domain-containing protein